MTTVIILTIVGLFVFLLIGIPITMAVFDKRCTHCSQIINRNASICPHCRTSFTKLAPAAIKSEHTNQIYIHKNGEQLGPFDNTLVTTGLTKGSFDYSDLCWRVGWEEWRTLATIFPNNEKTTSSSNLAQTFIHRNGLQLGPFDDSLVFTGLNNGTFEYSDPCWREGWENWRPLKSIFPKPKPQAQLNSDKKGVTLSDSIKICLSKYAIFEGRAGRAEYWWFYLFTVLLNWGAGLVGAIVLDASSKGFVGMVVFLIFFLPSVAVGARRLHDTGRSGWWLLIAFTVIGIIPLIIWLATESDKKENQYGPNLLCPLSGN